MKTTSPVPQLFRAWHGLASIRMYGAVVGMSIALSLAMHAFGGSQPAAPAVEQLYLTTVVASDTSVENPFRTLDPAPAQRAAAQPSRECWPAEMYPQGNWTNVGGGLQISFCFDDETNSMGDPILATLLARNITNQPVVSRIFYYGGCTLQFVVRDGNGRIVPKLPAADPAVLAAIVKHGPDRVSGQPYPAKIRPGTQFKWRDEPLWGYRLTNGQYTVTAFYEEFKIWDEATDNPDHVRMDIAGNTNGFYNATAPLHTNVVANVRLVIVPKPATPGP